MAVTNPDALAFVRPRWPAEPFEFHRAYLHFGSFADELVVYFSDRPVSNYSSSIETPDGDDVMVMIGMDEDGASTGEVVGIHVHPLAAGALRAHPEWRALADPSPPPEDVAAFVADVADLFERYWTSAPPMEEQLARLPRADRARGA